MRINLTPMQILQIVLPVFLIIFFGYLAGKNKLINTQHLDALNNFAYFISLPALIIASFWPIEFLSPGLFRILGFNLLALGLFAFLLLFGLNLTSFKNTTKAGIFLCALVGNAIYIGFPIGKEAFGLHNFTFTAGIGSVHLVLGTFLGIMSAIYWTKQHHNLKQYFGEFIKNPLIISMVLGMLLSFTPHFGITETILNKTINLLAVTASPVALFALGCFLSLRQHQLTLGLQALPVVLKLGVFPLFIFWFLKLFNLPAEQINISTFLSTMPTAVTTFVIAEKFKLDETLVTSALLITTALSVITISMYLNFIQ
jgi:predicted permease